MLGAHGRKIGVVDAAGSAASEGEGVFGVVVDLRQAQQHLVDTLVQLHVGKVDVLKIKGVAAMRRPSSFVY